ncbi:MAG TPA: HAMP domain-containing sensor histidine kinase [Chloroflexia bacterium]|jgi:signal transduction histidine kinase
MSQIPNTTSSEDKPKKRVNRVRRRTHEQVEQHRLLSTLEQLLSIQVVDVKSALDQVCDLTVKALGADKVDVLLYVPDIDTLVTAGVSNTALAKEEHDLGMDRLPMVNGGRTVEVFQTGHSYSTGHADRDAGVLLGVRTGLHVKSMLLARFGANGDRRGVLQALSKAGDQFSPDDLVFVEAVAHWLGMITYQAEMAEKMSRDAIEEARRTSAEEVVTVLAHDLNNYLTPLKARIGFLAARARREGHPTNIRDANEARSALDRLRALIDDLLDVARVGQNIFTLSRQPVDLVALVQQTAAVMGTRDADILLDLPDELVIQADPSRIRQALENLLANAVKYSPNLLPVHVVVRAETREHAEGEVREWAVISVRDEGPGIAASILPTLFTRFSSGPGSSGLGLGLYLAHSIATAHSGTLTVQTEPGKGTRFVMSLPSL